jgi:hypothetical protein
MLILLILTNIQWESETEHNALKSIQLILSVLTSFLDNQKRMLIVLL